ncbi:hypothetical protein Syun_013884 [Stephania yunnanensis]|uniref:Uncharacterized protein n=1 Tax=Stephania yunnanensis TaxID=152371 RepID=A0AAP0JIP6_9MAGN
MNSLIPLPSLFMLDLYFELEKKVNIFLLSLFYGCGVSFSDYDISGTHHFTM